MNFEVWHVGLMLKIKPDNDNTIDYHVSGRNDLSALLNALNMASKRDYEPVMNHRHIIRDGKATLMGGVPYFEPLQIKNGVMSYRSFYPVSMPMTNIDELIVAIEAMLNDDKRQKQHISMVQNSVAWHQRSKDTPNISPIMMTDWFMVDFDISQAPVKPELGYFEVDGFRHIFRERGNKPRIVDGWDANKQYIRYLESKYDYLGLVHITWNV